MASSLELRAIQTAKKFMFRSKGYFTKHYVHADNCLYTEHSGSAAELIQEKLSSFQLVVAITHLPLIPSIKCEMKERLLSNGKWKEKDLSGTMFAYVFDPDIKTIYKVTTK